MGFAARMKREIQYRSGRDPVPGPEIKKRLRRIEERFRKSRRLAPYDKKLNEEFHRRLRKSEQKIRSLIDSNWSVETVEKKFKELERVCGDCHSELHPEIHRKPTDKKGITPALYERIKKPAKESCGSCHQDVMKEWKKTYHARAWTDKIYRAAAKVPDTNILKTQCKPCHSPMPVLFRELSTAYGHRPHFRPDNKKDGVNCKTCHLRSDGRVAARHTRDAPCDPVRDPRILGEKFCGTCHNPTHNAYTEWKTSEASREGIGCNDCHTRKVHRDRSNGAQRIGVSHQWKGAFQKSFVKTGISLDAGYRENKRTVELILQNRSAHSFPGEVASRVVNIILVGKNDAGKKVFEKNHALRRPLKGESGFPDKRLRTDEKRTLTWAVPSDVASLFLEVYFQPSPLMLKNGWFELGTWTFSTSDEK